MQQIEDQLSGYDWKLKTGECVRLMMEPEYGQTFLVVNRMLCEEITGAFCEVYDVRRKDGLLARFYAPELVAVKNKQTE